MRTKYTPGPWVAKGQIVMGPGLPPHPTVESQIADCRRAWECRLSEDEAEANARLIAAAPDMLEALQKLSAMYNDFSRMSFDLVEIRSIIKTAIDKTCK